MAAWPVSGLSLGVVTTVITVSYLLYSGLLTHVTVATGPPPIKKVTIAYKFRRGPFRNCWSLFVEASKIGPELPRIGVFYDDPNKVHGPQCRYAVGSILSEEENEVDEEVLKRYETSGYKVFSFPEVTHAVTASFPYRTILSVFLRLINVYRPLQRYLKVQTRTVNTAQGEGFSCQTAHRRPWRRPQFTPGSRGYRQQRERLGGETLFKKLDREQTGGQQADNEERLHGDSNQKSLEAPAQEWWGVEGGEE